MKITKKIFILFILINIFNPHLYCNKTNNKKVDFLDNKEDEVSFFERFLIELSK